MGGGDSREAPELSTHKILFEDGWGRESASDAVVARNGIVQGAAAVNVAIDAGKKTLVHCEWGQNRSGAICCAYAVLYLRWTAEEAIEHMRVQNKSERNYRGQFPMYNTCFNQILKDLEKERDTIALNAPSTT